MLTGHLPAPRLQLAPSLAKGRRFAALSRLTLAPQAFLARHDTFSLGLFVSSLSLLSLLYFYHAHLITALDDSRSRLLVARAVVDGISFGPSQLGGIWLPIPQILMTPFVGNDFLYQSGLAGSLASMTAYVIACVFLYKLLLHLTANRLSGLTAVIVFSSPNLLYLQSTPMSEASFFGLWLPGLYFFVLWLQDPQNVKKMFLPTLFLFLISLTRYEGWAILIATSLVVVYAFWANHFSYAKAEGYFIFFATFAFAGFALWLLWNQVIFSDAFYFFKSQYSSRAQVSPLLSLPSVANLAQSLSTYASVSLQSVGALAAILAFFGLLYWLLSPFSSSLKLALLLLFVPFPFYVFMFSTSNLVAQNPALANSDYINTTYGILMAPCVAFFTGFLVASLSRPNRFISFFSPFFKFLFTRPRLSRPHLRPFFPALAILSTLLIAATGPLDIVQAHNALAQPDNLAQVASGQWLRAHYTGGLILYQRFGNETSLYASQIPLSFVVFEGDQSLWSQALKDPATSHIEWIFMRQTPDSTGQSDLVWQNLYGTQQLSAQYYLAYQKDGVQIYVAPLVGGP